MGVIYKLTSPSGKMYIGQTVHCSAKRFKKHISDSKKQSYKLSCAIRKYGPESFIIEDLEINIETKEELDNMEKHYISLYNSNSKEGYNMTPGGDGVQLFGEANGMYGKTHSPEARQKISDAGKNRGPISEEARDNMSIAKSGENNGMYGKLGEDNPNYGRKNTEETKEMMSKKQKEAGGYGPKHHSDETKLKISEMGTGRKYSIVTCPHCNKSGGSTGMGRWHFDNCKHKGEK